MSQKEPFFYKKTEEMPQTSVVKIEPSEEQEVQNEEESLFDSKKNITKITKFVLEKLGFEYNFKTETSLDDAVNTLCEKIFIFLEEKETWSNRKKFHQKSAVKESVEKVDTLIEELRETFKSLSTIKIDEAKLTHSAVEKSKADFRSNLVN